MIQAWYFQEMCSWCFWSNLYADNRCCITNS